MKKILFSLCILLICLLFCRFAVGNNAPISTEAMISYIADNFETGETINEMMNLFAQGVEGFDSILNNEAVREFFDNKIHTDNNLVPDISKFDLLKALLVILEILYNVVYYFFVSLVVIVGVLCYALPIVISLMRDAFAIFKLITYVLFGTAI